MKNNISEADWKVRVDLAAMFRLTNMMGWDDTVCSFHVFTNFFFFFFFHFLGGGAKSFA